MKLFEFIAKEFSGWGKTERFVMPLIIFVIVCISVSIQDSHVALVSAVCGICATILAGKGKISCYFFGIIANICYSYISYKSQFWGHLVLNSLYYLPMQFVGIANWKNHLNKSTQEIFKTELSNKERVIYSFSALISIIILYFILLRLGDSNSLIDSVTTVLSVIAFILTVKRCIEQWYVWTIVNALCVMMWSFAYLKGSNCFATILMWTTYFVLGIYFLANWQKEIKQEKL